MPKTVVINGSPRPRGNTSSLLSQIASGEDVTVIDLYRLEIKGCSGCLRCKRAPGCSIDDDMTPIYQAIEEADAVVIGSPIYMCEETASTKAFIERTYAFLENLNLGEGRPVYRSRLKGGKKAVAIFPCGSPLGSRTFRAVAKNYERHFKNLGFDKWQVHVMAGVHPGVDSSQDSRSQRTVRKVRSFLAGD